MLHRSDARTKDIAWSFIATCVVALGLVTVSLFTAVVSFGFAKLRNEERLAEKQANAEAGLSDDPPDEDDFNTPYEQMTVRPAEHRPAPPSYAA